MVKKGFLHHPGLKALFQFGFLALIMTVIFGTIYGTVQQNYRQSANDPQIQTAEDVVGILQLGESPTELIPSTVSPIDIGTSLAQFVLLYDAQGSPIAGTGRLSGSIPTPPAGVFDYVRTNGEDRITWEPERDVRIAAVIKKFSGTTSGFVVVGRSLREVEKREAHLTLIIFVGWAVALLGVALFSLFKYVSSKYGSVS